MRIIAIPVKSLLRAKRRLSPVLSPMERGVLTLAMLEDVLDATLAQQGWTTWVISPDEAVLEVAVRRGARSIAEERGPLSGAVRQVEQEAIKAGADALAIVPGDIAFVTTEAVTAALQTLGPVVLAPAHTDGGTNLLLRRPPRAIPARFGKSSYERHVEAAAQKGLPAATVHMPELSYDLDTPDELPELLAFERKTRAREAANEMGLASRLAVRT
jgi:2-phospho-L-lactate guanylyltransferase